MNPSALPAPIGSSPGRSTLFTLASSVEHETKLTVSDEFLLPRFSGVPQPRRILTSTYFDTASFDLAHAGITLRHRVERGRQAWQLKVPLNEDRQEIELADRSLAPPASLRQLLIVHLGHRRLVPLVALRVWRTAFRVTTHQGPVAEIALDSVAVLKDHCVIQRFRELEIERLNGDDDALEQVEEALRQAGAGQHDGRPKLFRALSLAAPDSVEAPPADAPIVEHIKRALARHVRWLLGHDPGTRHGAECESLHQMRVATRRLRAVLRAAQPVLASAWAGPLEKELSWLSQLLGPARDLDVQIAYFNGVAAGLGPRDRKPVGQFVTHLQTERRRMQDVVISELRSARYLDLVRRLRHSAHDPSVLDSSMTLRTLAKREFKRLRKAIRRLGAPPTHGQLHEVRIKTKRARYAVELAEPALGKSAARFMKQARVTQDLLGTYQDSLQAETHVRGFVRQSTSVRAGFVAGCLVERQRQRREEVSRHITPSLRALLKRGKKMWE